jgi:hypothetical protein
MSKILHHTLAVLSLGFFLALGFGLRCWNKPQIFHDGGVFFVDADCYSRMTRVLRVLEKPSSLRFHEFENAPFGVHPHTTAPMDFAIAGLAEVLAAGTCADLRTAAEQAGAFISPLLGTLLIAFLGWWAWKLRLAYRNALLLVVAVSPILVHGFLLGRPDHQSLILLLFGMALAAELAIWSGPAPGWRMLSAAAWALALWTSLFEPLILLIATLACRVVVLGRRAFRVSHRPSLALFGGLLLFALVFDGWRFHPGETDRALFFRWAQSIGELSRPGFLQLFPWTGWLLPVVPVLLLIRFARERCRICLALALLVLLTIGLTLWYARWGYFLALTFALCLPWAFSGLRWRPVVWGVFLVSLWPMASEWDRQFFPNESTQKRRAEIRAEGAQLRQLCDRLRDAAAGGKSGTVLAPWWLSPSIAYWSGLPCVNGSSHQSLPGTADSARFFLATSRVEAREILDRREVEWVITDDPSRVVGNSLQVLGRVPTASPLAQRLHSPRAMEEADWLSPVAATPFYRLFRVVREH